MDTEPTNQDILTTMNSFATHVDNQFFAIKEKLGVVKQDINHIKNVMVTKDYLDDKLADQKVDMVQIFKAEDHKAVTLVEELRDIKVLSTSAAKNILALKTVGR